MDALINIVRDLAVVSLLAGFVEGLLPNGNGKLPLKLIFGLYFLAVLLNPIINFVFDTEITEFNLEYNYGEDYGDVLDMDNEEVLLLAAEQMEREAKASISALYSCDADIEIELNTKGIAKVDVKLNAPESPELKEGIIRYFAAEYGVLKEDINIIFLKEGP